MSIKVLQHNNQTLWLSASANALNISHEHFEPNYLREQGLVNSTAQGRGTVYFFTPQAKNAMKLVLRHYYRGGLIGKVFNDHFIYTGLQNTRSVKEINILAHLHTHKVNVPVPIAARVVKQGLFYTADIITEAISSQELHHILLSSTVADEIWYKIGQQIKAMHNAQVCHYDINVKNVLLADANKDSAQIYLIDFDKCLIRNGDEWKDANLKRFLRSIEKQVSLHSDYGFTNSNWQALENGYH